MFSVVLEPPSCRRFRRVPAEASSADAWNGGLHIETEKVSPGLITPRKQSFAEGCRRHSTRSATAALAATNFRAQRRATGLTSEPTKRQPYSRAPISG